MELFRFAHKNFKDDISGEGARLFGGRWNSIGIAALYVSSTASLALLEVLAHQVKFSDLDDQHLITLHIPSSISVAKVALSKLKKDWKEDVEHTQFIGDSFLKEGEHLLLQVPSVVVPLEWNYVINPNHKDHRKIRIVSTVPFSFDVRLYKGES